MSVDRRAGGISACFFYRNVAAMRLAEMEELLYRCYCIFTAMRLAEMEELLYRCYCIVAAIRWLYSRVTATVW
jgi:hypothetical protein